MFFHARDMAKWKQRENDKKDAEQTYVSSGPDTFEKVMVVIVWTLVLAMAIGMVIVKSGGS